MSRQCGSLAMLAYALICRPSDHLFDSTNSPLRAARSAASHCRMKHTPAELCGLIGRPYWLVDRLMEKEHRVHLANTAAVQQYEGLKYTDDDSDARWLAHMLRLGVLPEGYIDPKEQRAVRDLLRKRSQLVRQKTDNLLSIQNLYSRNTGWSLSANRIKKLTSEQVDGVFILGDVALAVKA